MASSRKTIRKKHADRESLQVRLTSDLYDFARGQTEKGQSIRTLCHCLVEYLRLYHTVYRMCPLLETRYPQKLSHAVHLSFCREDWLWIVETAEAHQTTRQDVIRHGLALYQKFVQWCECLEIEKAPKYC